jgi:hypothetical protein
VAVREYSKKLTRIRPQRCDAVQLTRKACQPRSESSSYQMDDFGNPGRVYAFVQGDTDLELGGLAIRGALQRSPYL